MENNILVKNKYIVYNEDYKILVFMAYYKSKIKIFVPGTTSLDNFENEFESSIRKILLTDDIVFLQRDIANMPVLESYNYKLKKSSLQMVRNYYSCYREFSKEDDKQIMELCYKYRYKPYFLTIDELKGIIKNRPYHIDIDCSMYQSLDELDKRLKFIKY